MTNAVWPQQPPRAPEGTRPDTVWAWLVVAAYGAQLLTSIPLLVALGTALPRIIETSIAAPQDPSDPSFALEVLRTFSGVFVGSLVISLVSWLLMAAWILFGWLDWRELRKRGVPNPFHWAYGFLALAGAGPLVYLIGRTVVLRRRLGGGAAPMWVAVAITAVSLVGYAVWLGIVLVGVIDSALSTVSAR